MTLSFEAIGTSWTIEIHEPLEPEQELELTRRIMWRVDQFDQRYSRFRADSLVSRLAQEAGRHYWPADGQAMLELYRALYGATDGKVTPLIGQTLADAGYDAQYSLTPQAVVRRAPAWDEVLSYSHPWLTLAQPAWLDFGAAGKGHLVDLVAEVLAAAGLHSYVVDAGGDILSRSGGGVGGGGGVPLRVGLEHPLDARRVIGVAQLQNQSICGSAGNRRAWGQYHHIFDPHSAQSVTEVLATWVVAGTTLLADGLATALFFVEPERLTQLFAFEHVVVREGGLVQSSPNWAGELFTHI